LKHILFIATAFPECEVDLKGIFIKDYLLSIKDEFHCSIYVFRICSSKNGFHIEENPNYTVYRYSMYSQDVGRILKWFSYPYFLFLAFYKHKKINEPDIIHVNGGLYFAGTIGLALGKKLRKPVIYTEHMGRFKQFYRNRLLRLVAKWLLFKFDKITCVSSFTRSKIVGIGLTERMITIINNPVDTSLFTIDNQVIKGNRIAFVGRLDENKGIIRCLHAFKKLITKYHDLKLLIMGDGNQRKLVEEMLSYDPELSSRVEMLGFLEKKNIAQLLPSCLFLVAPSIIESFGIAVAEAMACGLPVIVGKNNGTSDFVNEEVGLIIDSTSVSELTAAMDWLILNSHKFDPLKIRSRITDNFCFEATGIKLSALYHSII
jgi:glycosyltransferase involved in cell wall biosynthesis